MSMKLLFILRRFPYPTVNGDQVRAYNQLKLLAPNHEITLLTRDQSIRDSKSRDHIEGLCQRVVTVPRASRFLFPRLALPALRYPFQTALEFDHRLRRAAAKLASETVFDVAHVQLARIAPVAESLPGSMPKVLDLVDALSVNMTRRAERSAGPLSWLARWEGRRMADYERSLIATYDCLVIASPSDQAAIGPYSNLTVVPNGVDINLFPFSDGPRQPGSIVFSGTMFYFPNVDAANWFAKSMLPAVRRVVPHAVVSFVGTRPTRAVRALSVDPGIEVTGFVPSVHDHIARAVVAIAPMRSGSGTQFKVLEAMAAGTPVVGTSLAFAGLNIRDGEEALVADTPGAFAGKVIDVLTNPADYSQLTRNARALVERRYDWVVTVAALETVYAKAIDAGRRTLVT